jgi:hypothetical protein
MPLLLPLRSIAVVAVALPLHRPLPSIRVAVALPSHHSVAAVAAYHQLLLLIPLLVGCCVVFRRPLSSSHAVMQPLTLSLPVAFAANCHPPPPPPPTPQLPLPLGRHHRHRHRRGQAYRCTLMKKEAAAEPPPAYQLPHHCENVYKSRQLGLI